MKSEQLSRDTQHELQIWTSGQLANLLAGNMVTGCPEILEKLATELTPGKVLEMAWQSSRDNHDLHTVLQGSMQNSQEPLEALHAASILCLDLPEDTHFSTTAMKQGVIVACIHGPAKWLCLQGASRCARLLRPQGVHDGLTHMHQIQGIVERVRRERSISHNQQDIWETRALNILGDELRRSTT